MALTLNGSANTIAGVAVGGLPDGIVDTDMLATDAVTAAKIGAKVFTSYALIEDQKSDTTDGGTFTNGDWRTRDLNTEVADPDGIVSISSNQFTLGAGSYLIKWKAPAHRVDKHQSRLRNITASSSHLGLGCYSDDDAGGYSVTISTGAHRAICSGSTVFEVQHRCQVTQSSYGFGVANDLGLEIYTQVEIYKEA